MYFKQIQEIINEILGIKPGKNETRRVCKEGESYLFLAADGRQYKWTSDNGSRHATELETILEVYTPSGRRKWRGGDTYAVSPGRGKPGAWWHPVAKTWGIDTEYQYYDSWQPLRIRLLKIRREPLQAISEADAVAEGCSGASSSTVDYDGNVIDIPGWTAVDDYRLLWEHINGPKSWELNPMVWVLTFEVVR